MSLQSPLGKVRGLGATGTAVHHWWVQRLTAVALVPLAVWLLVSLLALPALDFVTVASWIGGTWTASLLTLFVLPTYFFTVERFFETKPWGIRSRRNR